MMMMEVASSSINVWLPHITSRDYSFSHNKNTTQRPYTLLIGLQFNSLLSPQTLKTQKTHIHSPLLPQALYSSSSSHFTCQLILWHYTLLDQLLQHCSFVCFYFISKQISGPKNSNLRALLAKQQKPTKGYHSIHDAINLLLKIPPLYYPYTSLNWVCEDPDTYWPAILPLQAQRLTVSIDTVILGDPDRLKAW